MSGISLGVGISPTDGINSGAVGISSGAAGLAGSVGAAPAPPVTTYYQRQIPGSFYLNEVSGNQALIPGGYQVDGI